MGSKDPTNDPYDPSRPGTFLLTFALTPARSQANLELREDRDPFTDTDRSSLVVAAESEPFVGAQAALVRRCSGAAAYDLEMTTNEYLADDVIRTIYRVGDGRHVTDVWRPSARGAAAIPYAAAADRFTLAATDADRVVVGLSDHLGVRHEYWFGLAGLQRKLESLGCVLGSTAPPIAPGPMPERSAGRENPAATPEDAPTLRNPRPVAVLLDTVGYPQSGQPQASWIGEMPIEGGVTRLMAVFDATAPELGGPVRAARVNFVKMAGRADAVLVHDGGSPTAMVALEAGIPR